MAKRFVVTLILLVNGVVVYGQSINKVNKDSAILQLHHISPIAPTKTSSITFHLNKVAGVGPNGFNTFGIVTTDTYKNSTEAEFQEEYKAYPVMKNKPAGLTDAIAYFFIINRSQFYYQNYVAGIYTKSFLTTKLNEIKFNLADTTKLSRKPLKCYISVLAGFTTTKEPVYIADANNNGDYGDDTLNPLLKNVHDEDLVINSSVPVSITYLYKGQIKDDVRPVFIQQAYNPKKFELDFSFPEFKYLRFSYKGQPYLICTDTNPYMPFYTIMPDRPYFTSINHAKLIRPGQYMQIGDDNFKLLNVADNANEITLTGADISGFSANQTIKPATAKASVKNQKLVVSRQVGFKAPAISGINLNPAAKPGAIVATVNLKGKYVFVDFWSTSCAPCIAEFPYLKAVYSKFGRDKFEIIGVVDERDKGATLKIINQQQIPWPNIKTNTTGTHIAGYNDIDAYPTTFLLDPAGKIIAVDLRTDALMNKLKTLIGFN